MMESRILVADDDADIRGLVRILLERAGATVTEAEDGRAALRELYAVHPDLIVLDVNMPGLDGWETLERIRDVADVPVLMLTGRGDEIERVRGLRAGADDYVPKPFGRQELVARVEALLRRAGGRDSTPLDRYDDGLLAIDFARHEVLAGGNEVTLTPLEFRLLATFVRNPGQLLERNQLLELVWGDVLAGSSDQVKLYVGYLRRKLREALGAEPPIETVRGFGYRYRPPPA